MKVTYQISLLIAVIGCISCQNVNDIDIDDVKKKLEENIPGIDENDLNQLNNTKLPTAEDVEKVVREKCKKNGAENAVDDLQEQQALVKECVESYVNYTVVEEELNEAKKTGSMDEVFEKYCKKWPEIYACFDNVTLLARSCMDDAEKVSFNKSLEIVKELQEFMCFKGGDRLAMFVAEGGVECLTQKKNEMQKCLNSTLGARMPDAEDFSVSSLPSFVFSAKNCEDFDAVRKCVIEELEKCEKSTPANIVDAFFKFLKKQMSCDAKVAAVGQRSSSWLTTSSTLLVLVSSLLLKVYH